MSQLSTLIITNKFIADCLSRQELLTYIVIQTNLMSTFSLEKRILVSWCHHHVWAQGNNSIDITFDINIKYVS